MGKRLEDLNLGTGGPGSADDLGRARAAGARLLAEVLELLEDGQHDFAWGYLKSLSLTLEQTGMATEAQIQAVENVKAGKERHERQLEGWRRHERRTGRRYEGWTPSD